MAGVLSPEYKHTAPRRNAAAGVVLCQKVAGTKVWAKRLAALSKKKRKPAALEHVSAAAQAFAVGVVLHALPAARRVWILAHDLRAQESLSHILLWGESFPGAGHE